MKNKLTLVKTGVFKCPYTECELTRPCSVSSCTFNLKSNSISKMYKRCFLNYVESLHFNPFSLKNEYSFSSLSQDQKNQIVGMFYDLTGEEVQGKTREFYIGLFSIMSENAILDLKKYQLDPVPYRQCGVCGSECSSLYYPKQSILPPGWGYCSYACYQLKPPPILVLERNLEVDFVELIKNLEIEYESPHSRAKFVRQLVVWVLGGTPMT